MGRPSVYSCMTNGGIIEGQRSFLFRCSDLSPATYFPRGPMLETICTLLDQRLLVSPTRRCRNAGVFGSGETRMQMRNWQRFGGIDASRHLAPITL